MLNFRLSEKCLFSPSCSNDSLAGHRTAGDLWCTQRLEDILLFPGISCHCQKVSSQSSGCFFLGVIGLFRPGVVVTLVRFDGCADIWLQCVRLWSPACLSSFGFSMLFKSKDSSMSLRFWNSLITYLTVGPRLHLLHSSL